MYVLSSYQQNLDFLSLRSDTLQIQKQFRRKSNLNSFSVLSPCEIYFDNNFCQKII